MVPTERPFARTYFIAANPPAAFTRGVTIGATLSVVSSVIDRHLSTFSDQQRASLENLVEILRALLPGAEECMSYGMPCFKVNGKAVVGFDGFRHHNSYFPHSGSVLEHVPVPAWCETTKGALRFPIDRRLPKTLVRSLVRARMNEIVERLK